MSQHFGNLIVSDTFLGEMAHNYRDCCSIRIYSRLDSVYSGNLKSSVGFFQYLPLGFVYFSTQPLFFPVGLQFAVDLCFDSFRSLFAAFTIFTHFYRSHFPFFTKLTIEGH